VGGHPLIFALDLPKMNRIVTKTEADFWQQFGAFLVPSDVFDAQGDEHCNIDFRLVEKIEDYLIPIIGNWEQSDRWFHNLDFYGDGIRSLEFAVESFSPRYIPDLQLMLVDEHSDFTILCKVHTSFAESGTIIGTVAVRSNQIMVAYPLVKHLNGQI
jgi:hypothetical protein